ncbi:MAG: hypothetical protein NY202_02835 [Mollicutes bacterium UO1]
MLDYTQQLINKGNSSQQQNAQYLQSLIQHSNSPTKPTNKENKNSPHNPLIIGGIALIGFGLLAGYLWSKRRKEDILD